MLVPAVCSQQCSIERFSALTHNSVPATDPSMYQGSSLELCYHAVDVTLCTAMRQPSSTTLHCGPFCCKLLKHPKLANSKAASQCSVPSKLCPHTLLYPALC